MDTAPAVPVPRLIDVGGLTDLFQALLADGYRVIGQLRRCGLTEDQVNRVFAPVNAAAPAFAAVRSTP